MSSVPIPAKSKESPKVSDHLVEAVRAIVRDELSGVTLPPKPEPELKWKRVLWTCVTVANVILLVTELPDSLLKNTSIEFASKLVGYIFGGLFLVYSSWIRDKLGALQGLRWFQVGQSILLCLLLTARLPLFSIQPKLTPFKAQLFVDNELVKLRASKPLRLSLGNHLIRIAPKSAEESKLPDGTQMGEQEFVLGWKDMLSHWFDAEYSPNWTLMYPLDIAPRFDDGLVVIHRTDGPMNPEIKDGQDYQDMDLTADKALRIQMHGGARVYLPLGQYRLQEFREGTPSCPEMPLSIQEKENVIKMDAKVCGQ